MAQRKNPAWLKLAVDYGPLLIYFLAYRWWSPKGPAGSTSPIAEMLALTRSTAVFVTATLGAVLVSKWRFGRIEPMLWISAALVTVMGAMTVLLHDAFWIQAKPTFVYLLLAGALLGGWLRGKALLRYLMGPAFVGLDEEGWLTVSRNWGLLFVGFAALNELAAQRGVKLHATLAVGDGANDLDMLRAAGLGVAFHAKPVVAREAKVKVDHADLRALLFAQGYPASAFIRP